MPTQAIAQAANRSALSTFLSPTALIIGGTSGIGKAIAINLASLTETPTIVLSGRKKVCGGSGRRRAW